MNGAVGNWSRIQNGRGTKNALFPEFAAKIQICMYLSYVTKTIKVLISVQIYFEILMVSHVSETYTNTAVNDLCSICIYNVCMYLP